MKNYFSKIFSVYILLLALVPCPDLYSANACMLDGRIHIEQAGEEKHSEDHCTPMCYCLCCDNTVTISEKFIFESFRFPSKLNQPEKLVYTYHFLESDSPPPKS